MPRQEVEVVVHRVQHHLSFRSHKPNNSYKSDNTFIYILIFIVREFSCSKYIKLPWELIFREISRKVQKIIELLRESQIQKSQNL